MAILTGAGEEAFCTGNDLKYMAAGGKIWVPDSGFAGLTSRASRPKPGDRGRQWLCLSAEVSRVALACDLIVADEERAVCASRSACGIDRGRRRNRASATTDAAEAHATEMILHWATNHGACVHWKLGISQSSRITRWGNSRPLRES